VNEIAFKDLSRPVDRYQWLKHKANWIRLSAMTMTNHAQLGHTGGDLSCADILSVLYLGGILRVDTSQPRWPQRTGSSFPRGIVREPSIPRSLPRVSFLSNN